MKELIKNITNKYLGKIKPAEELKYNHIDFFYWRPSNGELNFGDHLSHIIVNKILAENNLTLEEETIAQKRLIALGSVIHFAKDGDTIWGSGINGKVNQELHKFKSLDVRAVRGPLTRQFLQQRGIKVPEVYGDPALLLPYLFKDRFKKQPELPFVIVPNLHDLHIAKDRSWKNVISPLESWNMCISKIVKAEFVIASSLHGLIVAEAYGIPARYIRMSNEESLFKYNDYMLGTGRGEIEFATSIDEAMEMGGMEKMNFDHHKLLSAFPFDLWSL
jgi:pyruvyltransferase